MWQNLKTQIVTKLESSNSKKNWKNLIVAKLKTQIVTKHKNSNCEKTQIVTNLKNTNCDRTLKLKLWQNSKTQIVTKLKRVVIVTSFRKNNCISFSFFLFSYFIYAFQTQTFFLTGVILLNLLDCNKVSFLTRGEGCGCGYLLQKVPKYPRMQTFWWRISTGGGSLTEGRQAEVRLRSGGPLGALFSLEVKAGIDPIQRPVRVLWHKFSLTRQVNVFFLVVSKEDFIFSTTRANVPNIDFELGGLENMVRNVILLVHDCCM